MATPNGTPVLPVGEEHLLPPPHFGTLANEALASLTDEERALLERMNARALALLAEQEMPLAA